MSKQLDSLSELCILFHVSPKGLLLLFTASLGLAVALATSAAGQQMNLALTSCRGRPLLSSKRLMVKDDGCGQHDSSSGTNHRPTSPGLAV